MREVLGISAAILAAAALAGCHGLSQNSGTLPPPLPPGVAGISEPEIVQARKLYVAKCAKCHRFYHPADYTLADWNAWMEKMSRKSKLNAAQEELLSRYLLLFRGAQHPSEHDVPSES